jgi:uncharacterized protein (TIGR02246 family)
MKKTRACLVIAAILAAIAVGVIGAKDKPTGSPATADGERKEDTAAINKLMHDFTAAFEKGDAVAAAACLTSGAELIPENGDSIRGRDAIQKAFNSHFASNPRVKITLDVESLRFTSKDTAIEEGTIKTTTEKTGPSTNHYSVLLVREDGKWLLGYVKEWPDENADLEDLDWLIGSWTAKRSDAEINTTYEWFGNKSFIKAQITIREKTKSFTAMQLIGTDPNTGGLRTWTFEYDGGFGEGTISRDGKKWVFETATALTDGSVLEANNILIQLDKNSFTWQPVNLAVDGEQFGDLRPVKVTRVK